MKKSLLIIIVLCSINARATTDSTRIQDLSDRVKRLETYKDEILDKKFDNKSTELSNKIDYEVKKAKDDVNDQLSIFRIAGSVLTLLIAAGVGALLYQYFVGIKKQTEKLFNKKLETHLSDNTSYIVELITSQKNETIIKANKKLLVLAGNEEEKTNTTKMLKGMGFKHVQSKTVTSLIELEEADLIVISNSNMSLPEELILQFLENSTENDHYIFFGKKLSVDMSGGNNNYIDRLNFANTKYTLYHQLINTLSFNEFFTTQSEE